MSAQQMKKSLALLLLIRTVLCADPVLAGPGKTGLNFIRLGAGVRQMGMGETAVAVADDVNAAFWNPAALGELKRQEASFLYVSHLESISYQALAYAYPISDGKTVAGHLRYFDYGVIAGYDNGGARAPSYGAHDLAASLGYGMALGRDFVAGTNLKYLSETIENTTGKALAADFGFLYRPETIDWLSRWRFALAMRNLGSDAKFISQTESLPRSLDLGVAYQAFAQAMTLALEAHQPRDNDPYASLGGEYWLYNTLALRLGYRSGRDLGNGLSYGVGLRYKSMQWDFALVDYGDFGKAEQVGLTYRFGGVGEDSYQRALGEQQSAHYAEAVLLYLKVLDINPDHRGARKGLKEAGELLRKERAVPQ